MRNHIFRQWFKSKSLLRVSTHTLFAFGILALASLLWLFLDWYIRPSDTTERTALTQLFATIVGGLLLLFGVYQTRKRDWVAEQGHITDRFSKAVEQVGSDKLEVRLGGIYALERIARDSVRDHGAVMELLTAYVRSRSPKGYGMPLEESVPTDVQAVLSVIGRRSHTYGKGEEQPLNLCGIDISGATLRHANLVGAHIVTARLVRVDMEQADLREAGLVASDLDGADLWGADLEQADLLTASLKGAYLAKANLSQAVLKRADLTGAKLQGANLTGAQVEGAILNGANLKNVIGLTAEQLATVVIDSDTQIPEHLTAGQRLSGRMH